MVLRVLAFEPSSEYRSIVDALLEHDAADQYAVHCREDYAAFLRDLEAERPELVMVSFGDLPAGEKSLGEVRRRVDAPIMAFVASSDETKAALRGGADYDLPKPFDPAVFVAAVEAVLRRGGGGAGAESPTTIGDLTVYGDRRAVERDGRRRSLSPTEWQLFFFLMQHAGRTFTRRELAAGAWGPGYTSRSGQVELYVSRVRRKIERDPQRPQLIQTVRGYGYRLNTEPAPPAEPASPGRRSPDGRFSRRRATAGA